ncbi:MAG: hypothetical protein AB7O49_01395 [Sphingomonadales bacterium]
MSIAAFVPFISVAVEDDGGKPIAALSFEPTPATEKRLADHRLIFRPRPHGFQLYARNNPEAGNVRVAPVTAPTSLVFRVRAAQSDFLARYHPDLDPETGPNFYLANLENDGSPRAGGKLSVGDTVETADAARLTGRRLNARADMTASPKPTGVKALDRYDAGRIAADVKFNAAAGSESAAAAVDLSADPGSAYTLAMQPSGAKTTIFADDDVAGRGALGVLNLVAAPFPGPEPDAGRAYTATFRRRS